MNSNNYASQLKRFKNWTIDGLIILTIWKSLSILVTPYLIKLGLLDWMEEGKTYDFSLTILPVYFLYYLMLEGFFKTTIGKIITMTKLININGKPITFRNALKRTIYRFIPFELLSYLSDYPVGLHDSLSNTRLLNKKQKQEE